MNIDANIITIIGWVLTIVGFIIVWNKQKHETTALDMAALKDAIDSIEDYSKQVKELRVSLRAEEVAHKQSVAELNATIKGLAQKYESNIFSLKTKIIELEEKLQERDFVIEDLRDWAERLCAQLISVAQVPVAIKVNIVKRKSDGIGGGKR